MTAFTSARSVASGAASRTSSWTCMLSAFIFGRSRRIADAGLDLEPDELTHQPIAGLHGLAASSSAATTGRRTGPLQDVVDRQRDRTSRSALGVMTCSAETTRLSWTMESLTRLSCRVMSLQRARRSLRSGETGSGSCHWPKNRTRARSPSAARAKRVCWCPGRRRWRTRGRRLCHGRRAEALQDVDDAVPHGRGTDRGAVGAAAGAFGMKLGSGVGSVMVQP